MLRKIHRGLWLAAALFFFLLGAIGLLLPVVPQIPFLLASALCLMRCSKRFNAWMEHQPWFHRLRARFQIRRH